MREDNVSREEMRARGAAIIVGHPRWGDFGLDAHEFQRRVDTTAGITARPILRTFFEYYAETQGKPRWGDKSPPYTWKAPKIQVGSARGPLHQPDPRRPRCRAVAERGQLGTRRASPSRPTSGSRS